MLSQKIYNFDRNTRSVNKEFLLNKENVENFDQLIEDLKKIKIERFNIDEKDLCNEIYELIKYRIFSLMLPEECLKEKQDEVKPFIKKHLSNLGIEEDEDLVLAIKHCITNFNNKLSKIKKKKGIGDLRLQHKSVYERILKEQNSRCNVCGKVLEYGDDMHLDHILPWHFGNDPNSGNNWQFLCSQCNIGKSEWPYYSLNMSRLVWLNSDTKFEITNPLRYAVFIRDKKCSITNKGPKETEFGIKKIIFTGPNLLDNLITISKKFLN